MVIVEVVEDGLEKNNQTGLGMERCNLCNLFYFYRVGLFGLGYSNFFNKSHHTPKGWFQ